MKTCIIQPLYLKDISFSDEYFEYKLKMLDECDDETDIIVLPEYSDVPCATENEAGTLELHEKYAEKLHEKCISTAKRCNSFVFVNALSKEENRLRNTTFAYDRNVNLVGKYFKKHLPPFECEVLKLDEDNIYDFSEPYILEIDDETKKYLNIGIDTILTNKYNLVSQIIK